MLLRSILKRDYFQQEHTQWKSKSAEKRKDNWTDVHQSKRREAALLRALGFIFVDVLPQLLLYAALLDAQRSRSGMEFANYHQVHSSILILSDWLTRSEEFPWIANVCEKWSMGSGCWQTEFLASRTSRPRWNNSRPADTPLVSPCERQTTLFSFAGHLHRVPWSYQCRPYSGCAFRTVVVRWDRSVAETGYWILVSEVGREMNNKEIGFWNFFHLK